MSSNPSPFRCCIIGHGKLTIACAEQLQQSGCDIVGIVSSNIDVRTWAAKAGIPHHAANAQQVEFLSRESFDYLFSVINPAKVTSDILALPQRAAINFHDAPLPRYAGLHVTSWAIQNREKQFGVTWHQMTADFDAGPILAQQHFPIEPDDTAFSLSVKCYQQGLETFTTLLTTLLHCDDFEQLEKTPQDPAQRSVFLSTQRPRYLGVLQWHETCDVLIARVKGLQYQSDDNPLATAKVMASEGHVLIVSEAARVDVNATEFAQASDKTPGTVLACDQESLVVVATDGALRLAGLRTLENKPAELLSPDSDLSRAFAIGTVLPAIEQHEEETIRALAEAGARTEPVWAAHLARGEWVTLADMGAAPPVIDATMAAVNDAAITAAIEQLGQHVPAATRAMLATACCVLFLRRMLGATDQMLGVDFGDMATSKMGRALLLPHRLCALPDDDEKSIAALLTDVLHELEALRGQGLMTRDIVARHASVSATHLPVTIDWIADDTPAPHTDSRALIIQIDAQGRYRWVHQSAALSAESLQSLLQKFGLFLQQLNEAWGDGSATEKTLAHVGVMTPAERDQVLCQWNRTEKPVDTQRCIHQLIEERVATHPHDTAVVFRDQSLSYEALNARANLLAHHLQALGAQPDSLVGVYIERSLDMVVALLAVHKAGAAYVPLDPAYPADRIALMLDDAQAPIVLTQTSLAAALPQGAATVITLDTFDFGSDVGSDVGSDSGTSLLHDSASGRSVGAPTQNPVSPVRAEHLAYVIYTSGSTGRPKGVMVEHRNVVNFMSGMDDTLQYDGSPGVWLAVTSISFDISVLEIFWSLSRGFKVVVQEEDQKTPGASITQSQVPAPLDVGLFYFSSNAGPADEGNRYRLLMEGAKFADRHGFSSVWTPERHFHLFGGLYPNPSVTSAAVAAVTERIAIRAGSIVLPLHNPIRIAEEWSVVDNLSNGRVGFSFASGWHANDFALKPENFAERKQIMFDGIEQVRKLWRGESLSVMNGEGKPYEARIYPTPVQKEPPMWITTAGNVDTFRAAGEGGFNVLTNLLGQSVADLTEKIAAYRAGRRAGGHAGDGHVSVMVHTFLGADVASVKEIVRAPFCHYLKTSFDLVKMAPWAFPAFKQPSKSAAQDSSFDASAFTDEDMAALIDHAFERYFETAGIFGTPQSVLPLIDQLKTAGVNEIACLIDFGVDDEAVLQSLPFLKQLHDIANPSLSQGEQDYGIAAQLRRHQVTHFQCTPSMARILTHEPEVMQAAAGLQAWLVGGEALPDDLAAELSTAVRGELINVYGPTETTIWSTSTPVRQGEVVTIGRPIANTSIYLLDTALQPVPVGVAGELMIGGRGVVRGYWQREALTAERFIAHPFAQEIAADSSARLYRTGDLARYRADGMIEYLGRLDHQVKLRGYRIELGEIESAICRDARVKEAVVVAAENEAGAQTLRAYVVPDPRAQSGDTGHWATIWDEAYRSETQFNQQGEVVGATAAQDPTLDISGWLDSFTGQQHDVQHMREWVEMTVDRILACRPQRVLEIGCGTGMLLHRVAPHCAAYYGVDLSPAALQKIRQQVDAAGLDHVQLIHSAVDQLDMTDLPAFDVIVVNSVIQYFPHADYLESALDKLSQVLTDTGTLFIGDVRHGGLKDLFDLEVELAKAPAEADLTSLRARVQQRQQNEVELLVAPDFFVAYAARQETRQGGMMRANIQVKRGHFDNEMSVYRYDVCLSRGASAWLDPEAFASVEGPHDIQGMQDVVQRRAGERLVFRDVPNARLTSACLRQQAFAAGNVTTREALQTIATTAPGLAPEAIYALAEGGRVEVHWAASGRADCVDVFVGADPSQRVADAFIGAAQDWSEVRRACVWQPASSDGTGDLIAHLKQGLQDQLPEYMVPEDWVVLGMLPLTPNGKIDRKALPEPEKRERSETEAYVAPANELEQTIARVFAEMLNLAQVGTRDNFFSLGANSLLIAQANNRLNQQLDQHVSLVAMYRYPTIETLAAHLRDAQQGNVSPSERAVKGESRAEQRKAALGARRARGARRR